MVKPACLSGILFLILQPVAPGIAASKAPARGVHAMVVSTEPRASQVGVDILQQGGNAVDAAVAVGFALAVTHPAAGNLGGGGFMMIRLEKTGVVVALDYRETAPGRASRDMYQDEKGNIIKDASTVGYRASGVPGTVAGMALALQKFGTMSLLKVMTPAITLARDGVQMSYCESESLRQSRGFLERFPETRRVYLREGKPYSEGELFVQPDLAGSLDQIAHNGEKAFYEGSIAQLIAKDMAAHGGLITLEDLKKYRPTLRRPLGGNYRGYRIVSMPSPSSGGIILLEMLNILEGFPLSKYSAGSSRTLHLVAETMKRAFADRAEFLGDGDFVKLPTKGLISKRYAAQIRATIDPYLAADAARIGHGYPDMYESEQTTHFSIVDKDGNAVANTYTLNGGYGSGVTIPGTGILMNNEMDDFASKPGVPNAYGLIQGEANSIAPGKRPLSAMAPTFVLRDDKLFMILGSPGGPTIINTVLQTIINVIDFKMTIQEAVDAPRIHHQWMPDTLVMERIGFADDVIQALRARGHNVNVRGAIGDCQAILIDPQSGVRLGAADPRLDGRAVGY